MNSDQRKRIRDRGNYNRAREIAIQQFNARLEADPNFTMSWEEFRTQAIKEAQLSLPDYQRRPRVLPENATPRQKYQQVYQKARHRAQDTYDKSGVLQERYAEFTDYWREHKRSYLPQGFLKNADGGLVPKGNRSRQADPRARYRVVHNHHRRCWEFNDADCWARFKTWERYWQYIKDNGLVPQGGAEPIADVVTFQLPEGEVDYQDMNGKEWFSRLPVDQFAPATHTAESAQVSTHVEAAAPTQDTITFDDLVDKVTPENRHAEAWPDSPSLPLEESHDFQDNGDNDGWVAAG